MAFVRHTESVVFDGYYGMRNTGDDAFCLVGAHIATNRWGAKRVAFAGNNAELPVLGPNARGLYPDRSTVPGEIRLRSMASMVRSQHVVHLGGSTFMKPLTRHRDQTRLARVGAIDLRAVGVSIGPFRDGLSARAVAETLRHFKSISTRDTASAERLRDVAPDIDVTGAFDVAVLVRDLLDEPALTRAATSDSAPVIGLSLCAHEAARDQGVEIELERHRRTVDAVQRAAVDLDASVRLLVFNDHPKWGDQAITEQARAKLAPVVPVEVVQRTRDPRDLFRAVASCDAVVATRLHAAIFAYTSGVPFAVVAYQAKGRDFAQEVGLADRFVVDAAGPDPDNGAELVRELLSGDGATQPRLSVATAVQRAYAAFPDDL
jgi:polysaccharide pyruvyl transferase WcaK-like protein